MDYYRVEFSVVCAKEMKQAACDLLAQMAGDVGFEAFQESEKGIVGYVEVALFDKNELDKAIEDFPIKGVSITYTSSAVVAEDWNREWENQGFEPIDISEKLLIYDARKPLPDLFRPIKIGIEARLAFGTGTHETTQMILSYLVTLPLEGKRVLDCGCGTGILGISALKLGAESVVAYDIDAWSVTNTLHNAELNDVRNIEVLEGDRRVLSLVNGTFDIVLANINRNILLADLPYYKEVLSPNGTIVLSGFLSDDIPLIIEKAGSIGLKEVTHQEQNRWTMLAFKI